MDSIGTAVPIAKAGRRQTGTRAHGCGGPSHKLRVANEQMDLTASGEGERNSRQTVAGWSPSYGVGAISSMARFRASAFGSTYMRLVEISA